MPSAMTAMAVKIGEQEQDIASSLTVHFGQSDRMEKEFPKMSAWKPMCLKNRRKNDGKY